MNWHHFLHRTAYPVILLLFFSCNPTETQYTILYSTDEPIGEICRNLEATLERNFYNVDIKLIIGEGSEANIDSVSKGTVDFTIIENHTEYKEGVSSVLVFYPQVLHIFYKGNSPATFKELVENKKVFIGVPGSGSYKFIMDLFVFFQVDQSKVTITENAFDEFDVYAGFSDIIPADNLQSLSDFNLYSFDDISQFGKGSIAEAICLKYPKVKPYIIPQSTYGNLTASPVLTISSNAVLVCRSSLLDYTVTDMIKTIFKEQEVFTSLSPLIFTGLDEGFDRSNLTFPLHNGARVFLDRDEPGFFERYAELAGVLFSIVIAVVSGIISLSRWQKQKKKDRVDVFYKVLMEIKNESTNLKSVKDTQQKIKEIQDSQNKAFEMLINEELEANESFRIFMELSKETISELRARVKYLRALEEKHSA